MRFEDLEEFYLRAWKDVGFEDDYQEQAYKKAGLEQLRGFVRKHEGSATLPRSTSGWSSTSRSTWENVVLEGQNRPDQPLGAGEHTVELVDYKTGRPRSQKDAD